MRKFAIYVVILSTFIPFTHSYSAEWTKFATMKVQSTDVTLFGDKTSLQIDENDDSKRTLLVKFELSDDMKSEYNDGQYRTRKEEYYFDCEKRKFTVAHTILINSEGKTVYDSEFHDPFAPNYNGKWYEVGPGSGPEIIYNKVCMLRGGKDTNLGKNSVEKSANVEEEYKGYKTSGYITGGDVTDGLDIKNLRWAPRQGFERLVFDVFEQSEEDEPGSAEPVDVPGYFEVSLPEAGNDIRIRLSGYRSFTAQIPDLGESKIIKNITVSKDNTLSDSSGYLVDVQLNSAAVFRAFELHKPGRIVLDIKERN